MTVPTPTQVPTAALGGDDILAPTQALLRGLSILPAVKDLDGSGIAVALRGTPDSVSIIEAGGTALSKGFASLIALLGGATAVTGAVTGFWQNEKTSVRVTLLGGSAFLLAAAAIAIAVIVAADVSGRAAGAVAQYDARQRVASAMVQLSVAAHGPAGSAPPATSGTILALAVAGASAPVRQKSTGVLGTLSGIRASRSEEHTSELQSRL